MDNGASSYRRFREDGDESGLVEIIRDYKDGLIFYLNSFVGNIHIAEELAEDTGFVFAGIVKAILRAISASYLARDNKLKGQVDSKLKSKIAQKKQAQGLRPENNGGEHSWEQNM